MDDCDPEDLDRFQPNEDSHSISNLFFLNGIASLLTWNIVLTSLDFYQSAYPDHNVYFYFPIPYFVSFALGNLLFEWLSSKATFKALIVTGITGTNIVLALILVVSLNSEDKTSGFWMCMALCLILGELSNITQLSFMGEMNYFEVKTVARYTIGTAAAGLIANFLRVICVLIFGTDVKNFWPIILYKFLVILFNFYVLFRNIRFSSTPTYTEVIEIPQAQKNMELSQVSFLSQIKILGRKMIKTEKNTRPFPWYILINFIFIFILFPGIALSKSTSLPKVWSSLLLLVCFNVGDTMGKSIAQFRSSFNFWSITYLLFARLFFVFTIPFLVLPFTEEDHVFNSHVFPFLNMWLFGFTGGIAINGSFVLLFEKTSYEFKKEAGVLAGSCIQTGIMIGTFLALGAENWVQQVS